MKPLLQLLDIFLALLILILFIGPFYAEESSIRIAYLSLGTGLLLYFVGNLVVRHRYYTSLSLAQKTLEEENSLLEEELQKRDPDMFRNKIDVRKYISENNLVALLKRFDTDVVVMKNVYLPVGNSTTEIDVIMIHSSGIYVFELKDVAAIVKGTPNDAEWTLLYSNGTEYKTRNAIQQNRHHVDVLRDLLSPPHKSTFKSIVVFTNRVQGLDVKNDFWTTYTHVCTMQNLLDVLNKQRVHSEHILSQEQITCFEESLIKIQHDFPEVKYKHRNNYEDIY
jgi:hypothetical protein